ncbi:SWIM zinc finger family protein [Kineosporia babensis]
MMDSVQTYTYRQPSELTPGGLGLETSGGTALRDPGAHPRFFTGFLQRPAVAAAGLLAVAEVARTRYFQPADTTFRDPVVTSDGERLRFESFSVCGGVHLRLDVLGSGFDGDVIDRGTTNVDVNEPLRRMLSGLLDGQPLHLAVGPDDVTVTTKTDSVVERKVPLPARWVRGFGEIYVLTSEFDARAEIPAAEASRLLRSLPSQRRAAGAFWFAPAGRSLRLVSRPVPGAVCLPGPQRLSAILPLLRFATGLRVYGPGVTSTSQPVASAWELALPGMRLTATLSPDATRGFSGEGAVLDALSGDTVAEDADLVSVLLAFEPRIDLAELAAGSGLTPARVRAALVRLGAAGRVGHDLAEAASFHRELPFDGGLVEQMNPRHGAARALVAAGAVSLEQNRPGEVIGLVSAGDHTHRVRLAGDRRTCTCVWFAKHQGSRGPCKHVLAVEQSAREEV